MKIHFELPSTRKKSYAYPQQTQTVDGIGSQTKLALSSIHSFQSHRKRWRRKKKQKKRRFIYRPKLQQYTYNSYYILGKFWI